jgi:hypothetical protein
MEDDSDFGLPLTRRYGRRGIPDHPSDAGKVILQLDRTSRVGPALRKLQLWIHHDNGDGNYTPNDSSGLTKSRGPSELWSRQIESSLFVKGRGGLVSVWFDRRLGVLLAVGS